MCHGICAILAGPNPSLWPSTCLKSRGAPEGRLYKDCTQAQLCFEQLHTDMVALVLVLPIGRRLSGQCRHCRCMCLSRCIMKQEVHLCANRT